MLSTWTSVKAFDKGSHGRLIQNVNSHGVHGELVNCLDGRGVRWKVVSLIEDLEPVVFWKEQCWDLYSL